MSARAIVDLRRGLAEKLQALADGLKAEIRSSAVVHADETGWREDGQSNYVWAFSTDGEQAVHYYLYDQSREQQVVGKVLGDEFRGVLESDVYAAYNVYTGRHQRCGVHLLRELHALQEKHPCFCRILEYTFNIEQYQLQYRIESTVSGHKRWQGRNTYERSRALEQGSSRDR